MTRYKHYPYQSLLKWIIKPRQSHMIDALERRPEVFRGNTGSELRERLSAMKGWLKIRALLIVLLSFSIVVTAATWTMRLLDFLPGREAVMSAVAAVSNVTTGLSGLLALLYVLTLRTLGQLEMDALLLLPSHRSHWATEEDKAHEEARVERQDERRVPSGAGRAGH